MRAGAAGRPGSPAAAGPARPERGRREAMGRHSGARSLASAAVPGRLSDRDPPAEPGPARASRPAALPR